MGILIEILMVPVGAAALFVLWMLLPDIRLFECKCKCHSADD